MKYAIAKKLKQYFFVIARACPWQSRFSRHFVPQNDNIIHHYK